MDTIRARLRIRRGGTSILFRKTLALLCIYPENTHIVVHWDGGTRLQLEPQTLTPPPPYGASSGEMPIDASA